MIGAFKTNKMRKIQKIFCNFLFALLTVFLSACIMISDPVDKCSGRLRTNGVSMLSLEHGFAWSPDGKFLAYTDTDRQLLVKDMVSGIDGSDKLLVSTKVNPNTILWAPDGQKIAYTSYENENWSLFVIDLPSGQISKLSYENEDTLPFLAWKNDSQYIFHFQRSELPLVGFQALDLIKTNIDTLEKVIVFKSDTSIRLHDWKASSGELLYSTNDLGSKLYLLSADGEESVKVTNMNSCERQPKFVLNENAISFISNHNDNWDIFVTTDDKGNTINLTQTSSTNEFWPDWSADDENIVYTGVRNIGNQVSQEIYVMDNDGNRTLQLTNTVDKHEFLPLWSPNGEQIAFIVQDLNGSWSIDLIDPDGTDQTTIISQP